MTLGSILAVVLLIAFLVTLILSIGSYAAYKMREKRKPKPLFVMEGGYQFFERYVHTAAAQAAIERLADEREAAGTDDTLPPQAPGTLPGVRRGDA